MAKGKSYKQMKQAKKKGPDDYRCLLGCMMRSSKGRDIRFTMIDEKSGKPVPVGFRDGETWFMGSRCEPGTLLAWLSRHPDDFERLYYAAAKESVGKRELAMGIAIAKLADLSGRKGRPAKVVVSSGGAAHVVEVARSGKAPVYRIDGAQTDPREAERFIRAEYIPFMIGLKAAVKALENGTENREAANLANAGAGAGEKKKIEPIDIEARLGSALGKPKAKEPPKRPKVLLGEQFLANGLKGYVGIRKEEENGKV